MIILNRIKHVKNPLFSAVLNGLFHKIERIFNILICRDPVRRLHIAAPAVDSADTAHTAEDAHYGAAGIRQFIAVRCVFQLLRCVWEHGKVERLAIHNDAQVTDLCLAGICMVAAFLRNEVMCCFWCAGMYAECSAFFAVRIRLAGKSFPRV